MGVNMAEKKKTGRSIRSAKQQEHTKEAFGSHITEIEKAKQLLNKQLHIKPAYNNPDLMAYRLAEYIAVCKQNERPLTETGLYIALDIDNTVWKAYLNGERDYIGIAKLDARETEEEIQIALNRYRTNSNEDLQYWHSVLIGTANSINDSNDNNDINDINTLALSKVCKKARQLISLEREERLATSGKVADIYTMKAREGEDWQETAQRTEHVLKIEGSNAQTALEQLGYSKK
jgi:hypothetical protein